MRNARHGVLAQNIVLQFSCAQRYTIGAGSNVRLDFPRFDFVRRRLAFLEKLNT
jgi:hypothetical protein